MGPIKIRITTSQLDGASSCEYGGGESIAQLEEKAAVTDSSNEQKENVNTDFTSPVKDIKEKIIVNSDNAKSPSSGDDCYSYEGSDCFYTDPSTGAKYLWSQEKEEWVSKDSGASLPPSSQGDNENKYKFDGTTYVYRDKLTGQKHKWNLTSSEWEVVEGDTGDSEKEEEESEEDENTTEEERKARQYRKRKAAPGWQEQKYVKDPVTGVTTYTDPSDGVAYELDPVKNAWFPKLDEEFMAIYQLNYGFTKDGVAEPTKPQEEKEIVPDKTAVPNKLAKQEPSTPSWFDEEDSKSCKVYVSNLPDSMTEENFEQLMSKCGMIENDVRTKKAKIKLYRNDQDQLKGDGLCTYIKPESVQLALTILDESLVDGKVISVTRAKFEMKGEYDPKLKPKKLTKKQLEKAKKAKERIFAWVPEKLKGERSKNEKVVVISNMFTVQELDEDPGLILDLSNRIRSDCGKFGNVTKVSLYDKHPDGVCQVFFREPSEADMAVQMLHGRMFRDRVLAVITWDGKTKYKMNESKAEESERLQQWEKYLHSEEDEKGEKLEKPSEEPNNEIHEEGHEENIMQ